MWRMLIATILLALCGCSGSSNPDAPKTTQAHEAAWINSHDHGAVKDIVPCQLCHGLNFEGNGSVPACSECHPGGGPPFLFHLPGPEPALPWIHPSNHGFAAKQNIKGCQGCHGQKGGPGSNPRFDRPIHNLERGCESGPGCHNNVDPINAFNNGHNPRAGHPSLDPSDPGKQDRKHWYGENIVYRSIIGGELKNYPLNHSMAGNINNSCSICHGARLEGGAGPACMDCHVLDPVANPSHCVSCHGPLPGQIQSAPLKPAQLAALAGRNDLLARRVFRNFTSELTARMRRDPSRVKINPVSAVSGYYYQPSGFVSYTSVANLSKRSSHLHHETLPCGYRRDNATCSGCHTANSTPLSNLNRHHSLMSTKGLGCANCHLFSFGINGFSLGDFRNCSDCHSEHFCR